MNSVYKILKVISYICIGFWILMGLLLKTTDGQTMLFSSSAIVIVIFTIIPISFLVWRYKADKKMSSEESSKGINENKEIKVEAKEKISIGTTILKVISIIWCLFLAVGLSMSIGDSDSVGTAMSLVFAFPALMYLILKSKPIAAVKEKNSNVTNKKIVAAGVIVVLMVNFGLSATYKSMVKGIRVTSTQFQALDRFESFEEAEVSYGKATINLYVSIKGSGDAWYSKEVKLKNLDDENNPYYNEGKIIEMEDNKLSVDNLTNGKYVIEFLAYESNPNNKTPEKIQEMSYTVTTEFVVEDGYNSKDEFMNAYNEYKAEELAKLEAEEEKRKEQERIEGPEKEKKYYETVVAGLADIGKSVMIIDQAYNTSDFDTHASEIKNLINKCTKLRDVESPTTNYNEIDLLVDLGCDKYIESAGNMANGVLKFDTSYFDLAQEQSKEAGKYFEEALYKMDI